MTSRAIQAYFDETANRETRDDLRRAVELVDGPRIAVDCGCGAGSDIGFLRLKGFRVHAFDIEAEAITRCRRRFRNDPEVVLSQDSFSSFEYPQASLVLAESSLFFCPETEFVDVWPRMTESLLPGGVFVGSFLGPDDTMAAPENVGENLWPEVLVVSADQVRGWFYGFDIISFNEHKSSGQSMDGEPHRWHVFSVVARKKPVG